MRLQSRGIDVHRHYALFAAVRIRNRGPRDGGELGAKEVEPDIVQFLLRELIAAQSDLQNRNA